MIDSAARAGTGGSCAVVAAALVARYGGDLASAAACSVEAHLSGCASCRAELAGQLDQARLARNGPC